MICFDDLPSDPLLLKQKLVEIAAMVEALSSEKIALAGERDAALAQREATLQENEKLLLLLSQFKRMLFGRRSEKVDPDQLHLLLSEAESGVAAANENEAPGQADGDDKRAASARPSRPSANRNRGRLPLHLPRVDVVIDIDDKSCPCCGGEMHKIGETVKEIFDVVPLQYRVKRIIRPRYGCRACESAVVQAPAPLQAIDGGMVTEAFLAYVAVMKYAYHMPLYRLVQMLASQGISLDRSTLAFWMGRVAWWLKPLHELLIETMLNYPKLFADETPLPVLDPGRGKTKKCQLWAIATDDRPWGGPAPPAVAYVFAEDRKGQRAKELLSRIFRHSASRWLCRIQRPRRSHPGWRSGDNRLLLCACTKEVLRRACRDEIADRRRSPAPHWHILRNRRPHPRSIAGERLAVRQAETKPLIEEFKLWLDAGSGGLEEIRPRRGNPLRRFPIGTG